MMQSKAVPVASHEINFRGSLLADRVFPYASSIFDEMSSLASKYNAINLGQGVPDLSGPESMLQQVTVAMQEGFNQYPPPRGYLALREAVVAQIARDYGLIYDPVTECMITFGATEALTVALMSTVNPGDEVITFEPFYDSYAALISLIGARQVLVPLKFAHSQWNFDLDLLEKSITPATRVILLNSPHNPTGAVISESELIRLAQIVEKHNMIVICDEVYEHLVYGSSRHIPFASLPAMRERTIRISSASKTFSVTGWKIGWLCTPAALLNNALTIKQHMTFSGGSPFQLAVAQALEQDQAWIAALRKQYEINRQNLSAVLQEAGLRVYPSAGTYFLLADIRALGLEDGREFCLTLPEKIGVAAVPLNSLTVDHVQWRSMVRFSFAKNPEVLARALERLKLLSTLNDSVSFP